MSRQRTIKIAALNIAMHKPHSADRYIALMQDAYALQRFVRQGNLHGVLLGSLYFEDKDKPKKGLNGELYRFVNLDTSEPWFNALTKKEATEDDVSKIRIPNHLLPHLQRIPFVFKPDVHELWFVCHDRKDNLGPRAAVAVFKKLFDELTLDGKYPNVEVTALPDSETLERMLSLPTLEKLTIELKRPNADDGAADEVRWLKRLEKQNARKMSVELVAEKDDSIKPDDETRGLAAVAARNGNVSVIGRDAGGQRVDESTEEKPLIEPALVFPEIETVMNVLRRVAGLD